MAHLNNQSSEYSPISDNSVAQLNKAELVESRVYCDEPPGPALKSSETLDIAKTIIYEHIKSTPSGNQFFSEDGAHKRSLVQVMLAIDNNKIQSREHLIEVMLKLATEHNIQALYDITAEIETAIKPDIDDLDIPTDTLSI